jgi:hypothetical protein
MYLSEYSRCQGWIVITETVPSGYTSIFRVERTYYEKIHGGIYDKLNLKLQRMCIIEAIEKKLVMYHIAVRVLYFCLTN